MIKVHCTFFNRLYTTTLIFPVSKGIIPIQQKYGSFIIARDRMGKRSTITLLLALLNLRRLMTQLN